MVECVKRAYDRNGDVGCEVYRTSLSPDGFETEAVKIPQNAKSVYVFVDGRATPDNVDVLFEYSDVGTLFRKFVGIMYPLVLYGPFPVLGADLVFVSCGHYDKNPREFYFIFEF